MFGACSAIWTFEYEEYDKDSEEYKNYPDQTGKLAIVNHEIDIELPTANADFDTPTFRAARFNTYEMENRSKSHFQTLPEAVDDGPVAYLPLRLAYRRCERAAPRGFLCGWTAAVYQLRAYSHPCQPSVAGYLVPGVQGQRRGRLWRYRLDPEPPILIPLFLKLTLSGSPLTARRATRWETKRIPRTAGPQIPSPRILRPNGMSISATEISPPGAENWTAYGGAEVSDGRGILRTGSATHTLSQSIAVQPNMTYTLKADIVSDGTRVTLGVRKANGSANTHEIYTDSGEKVLTFTTGKSCREMEVYVQVERYQDGAPAYVDNISVISGKNAPTSPGIPAPEPEPAEPPAEKPEFIVNGAFADGSSGWSLSGGPRSQRALQGWPPAPIRPHDPDGASWKREKPIRCLPISYPRSKAAIWRQRLQRTLHAAGKGR